MSKFNTCCWWLHPGCRQQASQLTLACCQQGHIHERLLCSEHSHLYTDHIDLRNAECTICETPLTRHLTKTIRENRDP